MINIVFTSLQNPPLALANTNTFTTHTAASAADLERIELLGPEGQIELGGASAPSPDLAVITDQLTGRIQSIIREWDETLPTPENADVLVTDGITTRRIIGGM